MKTNPRAGNASIAKAYGRKIGVDSACYELADHFMADIKPRGRTAKRRRTLAEAIQLAVEDWFYETFDAPPARQPHTGTVTDLAGDPVEITVLVRDGDI